MIAQTSAIVVMLPLMASFCTFFSGWWFKRAGFSLVVGALAGCTGLSALIINNVFSHGSLRYRLGGWPPPWGIELNVDPFSAFMLAMVSGLSLLTAVYAKRPVEMELADRTALFWCLFLLLVTGLLGIIVTGDMFNLFVLLEVASLTSYALVGMGRGHALLAAFRYLIIGTIGASFYLIGTGYLYAVTGSLNMADLSTMLPDLYASRAVKTAFVFIIIGFGIKIALFPLHAWQPDAYTFAPSAVSVILSTAVAKTFTYALIRVIFSVFTLRFITEFLPLLDLLCWLAALAMLAGSIVAIRQSNLKRMLAYSSIANVGYIVMAIGLAPATTQGIGPAVMHILNHAVIKGCLFMGACAVVVRLEVADIRRFDGLGRRMPLTCMALLLASLAIIGMPPSAGFVTKWFLILAVLEAGKYPLVAVILASTLLMIVYFWRLIEAMYVRPLPGGADTDGRIREAPASMLFPCLTLGVLTFAVGIAWMTGLLMPVVTAVNTTFGLGAP
jgi:multicomponent Na+:H+ antiporter subunit D